MIFFNFVAKKMERAENKSFSHINVNFSQHCRLNKLFRPESQWWVRFTVIGKESNENTVPLWQIYIYNGGNEGRYYLPFKNINRKDSFNFMEINYGGGN